MSNSPFRTELLETYRHAGQHLATVYIPTPSAVTDADERFEIRRKNVVSDLKALGASEPLLARVGQELEGLDHTGGPAHLFVVSEKEAVLSSELKRPLAKTLVKFGAAPSLLPALRATETDVEHLAVLVDRSGADVMLRQGVGDPLDVHEVEGPDVRLHRSHPGGWSQKRFQQTAENAWENNAREVVDQISSEFTDVEVVIYGGDVRAAGFFAQHLPERFTAIQVDGSRHADHDAFLDAADTVLRDRAAESQVELLDRWRSVSAGDNGVTGDAVLNMLVQGRVEHLLVVNDTLDSDRPEVGVDFDENVLAETGLSVPTTDAAVYLATATGARVSVIPRIGDVEGSLAAILRF